MSRVLKTIECSLTPSSINKAIREINRFKKQIQAWTDDLVRKLVEDGITVAKMNVMHMNAVFTGQLEESIQGVFFPEEKMGVIFTDVPYALFVEYGTGFMGAGTNVSPLPEGYEHDYNHHGPAGWVYFLTTDGINKFCWTNGMVARPYMYETLKWLEENVGQIAEDTFGGNSE